LLGPRGWVSIALQLEVLRASKSSRVGHGSLNALLEKGRTDVDGQSHHAKQDEHQQSRQDKNLAARGVAT
jgi:hypothetical protein